MLKITNTVKTSDLEQMGAEALKKCLQPLPFVQSISIGSQERGGVSRPDLVARLATRKGEIPLIADVKNSGQPRIAREALNRLILYRQQLPGSYAIFLAPYISSQSADLLRRENVGYIDFSGNCFLSFDDVYISVEGRPNLYPQNRDLKTIFSPRASRVIRVLLTQPYNSWKTEELSREAEVSLGLVANVKKLLLEREWAKERKKGFVLAAPNELLREWARTYSYKQNEICDFYSMDDQPEVERQLAALSKGDGFRFALTLFSGAARVAPYTRFNRVFAYAETDMEWLKEALNLKPVPSGANVTLLVPYDSGVFYGARAYDDISVVSPVQLYLDLVSYKGRGEEAAQFLFERVIGPLWSQGQTTENEK
jgi:hypothetical protein